MRARARGFSLIELMVALAIGSLLIVGAVLVYSQSRQTYQVNETAARLQENARYVLGLLEPELQLAGYYGYTNVASAFTLMSGGNATSTTAESMRSTSPPVGGPGGYVHACGNNFAVDLLTSVEGSNDAYGLACAAEGGGHRAETDTLTIRRAGTRSVPATNDTLQLLVNRLGVDQRIFEDNAVPASPPLTPGTLEVRDLIVRTYYVSRNSEGRPGIPALREKTLTGNDWDDEEIMSGVEDLQVQFGIDDAEFNGVTTRYVDPDDVPAGAQITAVRLWLLLRAEEAEVGFTDAREYEYAGKSVTPNDGFRRVLVSRTIQLRNSRTL